MNPDNAQLRESSPMEQQQIRRTQYHPDECDHPDMVVDTSRIPARTIEESRRITTRCPDCGMVNDLEPGTESPSIERWNQH